MTEVIPARKTNTIFSQFARSPSHPSITPIDDSAHTEVDGNVRGVLGALTEADGPEEGKCLMFCLSIEVASTLVVADSQELIGWLFKCT